MRLLRSLALVAALVASLPTTALAEPAGSASRSLQAGMLDAGNHTCAIAADGVAYCWGSGSLGRLGVGDLADRSVPTRVLLPAGSTARSISASTGAHAWAVLRDGRIACWGDDSEGQVGNGPGPTTEPTPVLASLPVGRTAQQVSTGDVHTCALLDDGAIACWGSDSNGRLGNGAPLANTDEPVLVTLPVGRLATAVSVGDSHSCAILDDGSLRCWGSDFDGQLGDGRPSPTSPRPSRSSFPPAGEPSR
ncbi:MAG: hypothetical protein R3C15_15115 [Thermoleophilia bacterium]